MSDELSLDEILELEKQDEPKFGPYERPEQDGPIRRYEKEMRCVSRRCGSPTYYKFRKIPYCWIHVIDAANDYFISMGVHD